MTVAASAEDIARALGQVTVSPQGYKCRCPAHEDSKASLMINLRGNGDGRPTVHCFAGCSSKQIFAAIEEQTGMHFEARETPSNRTKDKSPSIYPAPIDWAPIRFRGLAPVAFWPYHNADGQLMFVVARYQGHNGKDIRPFSVQDVNGNLVWKASLGGLSPLPLFNLPELLEREEAPILVVEGEKAAMAAKKIPFFEDFVVTTYHGGAKTWKKADWTVVKGRRIYLWPDNDDAGREQFFDLAKFLNLDQFCQEVRIANIPKTWPEKWDLADPLPEGELYGVVSWSEAPKGGFQDILRNTTPANYMESFDALYYLVYDGARRYTVSKQYMVHSKGRPLNPASCMYQINSSHPAYNACFPGRQSGLVEWAAQKGLEGDYYMGFRFAPSIESAVVYEQDHKYLNTFTGFGIEADPKGDCSAIKQHIKTVICDNDEKSFNYLFNYLAHIVQRPGERPTVALVFKGKQGTGKSFLFQIIAALLGGLNGYATKLETMDQATGRFNAALESRLVLWIEELELTQSRGRENRLKTMITDPFVHIERKGKDGYDNYNYARVMGSTNHEHIWNVGDDERRLSVFEVSEDRISNIQYFSELAASIRDIPAMRRLMYELMTWPIDQSQVLNSLKNRSRSVQRLHTLSEPNIDLAYDLLKAGRIELEVLDARREKTWYYMLEKEVWEEEGAYLPLELARIVLDERIKSGKYLEKKFSPRDRRVVMSEAARVMGCVETSDGTRNRLDQAVKHVIYKGMQKQQWCYVLPKLAEARAAFCRLQGYEYADAFGYDDEKIVSFRRKKAESDDVPF